MFLELLYLVTMLAAGGLLLSSFLLGEMLDWVDDLGESILNGLESAIEALPFVDEVDLSFSGGGESRSGFGTVRSILVFLTLFGGGGYLSLSSFSLSRGWSMVMGVLLGAAGGILSFLYFGFLAKQESTAAQKLSEFVGQLGTVSVSIDLGRIGAVVVSSELGLQTLRARSNQAIAKGLRVRILSVDGGVATVQTEKE